jgi:hypothetical protein
MFHIIYVTNHILKSDSIWKIKINQSSFNDLEMTVQRAELLHNLKNSTFNFIFEIVKFIAEVFVQERLLISS